MKRNSVRCRVRLAAIFCTAITGTILCITPSWAQQPSPAAAEGTNIPRLVQFSGVLKNIGGRQAAGLTFALYKDQQGGAPVWMETQNVTLDENGRYTVQLGATTSVGLPVDVFTSGEARWLGIQPDGQPEQPRVLLVSVPCAMKAADAETVGGLPPSAFMLATTAAPRTDAKSDLAIETGSAGLASVGGTGTLDFIPLWTPNGSTLGNSILFQSAASDIGVGIQTPGAKLDVNGSAKVRGSLLLPATSAATASAGADSEPLNLDASAFNSGTTAAVDQTFRWQAEPTGNNTASPSATLNLLFGSGTNAPAETGFRISNKGLLSFAAFQTFPGGTITGSETINGNLQAQSGSFTSSNSGDILIVQNQNTSGGIGIVGTAAGTGGVGMEGNALGTGGAGVQGSASAANGIGVRGKGATGVTGTGAFPSSIGVQGIGGSSSTSFGVIGTSGGVGVSGTGNTTAGSNGIGVTGLGAAFGVSGSGGNNGTGVQGKGSIGVSGTGIGLGIIGSATGSFSQGAVGEAQHQGVVGLAVAPSGNHQGVFAQAVSPTGTGTLSVAVAESKTGQSLIGCCAVGVWGDTNQATSGAAGLVGTADDAQALFLQNNSTTHLTANINNVENTQHGVKMVNIQGAFGSCSADSDGDLDCTGDVEAPVVSTNTIGKIIANEPITIFGPVDIIGNLSKSSGSFKIDHPLDPANKYLYHSFVESPDMMNIYNGLVTLDAHGAATVQLPDYFEALNGEFRYQLTSVGSSQPGLYVAEEVSGNSFEIAGGNPGGRVSWQVTGIRHDAYANAHRIPTEVEKPAGERGKYLNPELFGASPEQAIFRQHPGAASGTPSPRQTDQTK